jgi:hypothetical protein
MNPGPSTPAEVVSALPGQKANTFVSSYFFTWSCFWFGDTLGCSKPEGLAKPLPVVSATGKWPPDEFLKARRAGRSIGLHVVYQSMLCRPFGPDAIEVGP